MIRVIFWKINQPRRRDWSAVRRGGCRGGGSSVGGASLSPVGLLRCDQRYALRWGDLGSEGAPACPNGRLEANDGGWLFSSPTRFVVGYCCINAIFLPEATTEAHA
jgi:hypothetical protein